MNKISAVVSSIATAALGLGACNQAQADNLIINLEGYNGQYITIPADKRQLTVTSSLIGADQRFELIDLNGGSLRSGDLINIRHTPNNYLIARLDLPKIPILGDSPWGQTWETYQLVKKSPGDLIIRSGDMVNLRTYFGTFVGAYLADPTVPLVGDSPRDWEWETFRLLIHVPVDEGTRQTFLVADRPDYDYVPTALFDGRLYHVWWCSPAADGKGDAIYHATARSANGPYSTPEMVFRRYWQNASRFDSLHACDPSVILINGVFYMYYGGAQYDGSTTMIGAAKSTDGRRWTRLNNGAPIVRPVRNPYTLPHWYGAGQPSVFHRDGWTYMAYTDTTAPASSPHNGAGTYVIRCRRPDFIGPIEELTASGFRARSSTRSIQGTFAFFQGLSVDWAYCPMRRQIVVAANGSGPAQTDLQFFDATTFKRVGTVTVPGIPWVDGPGILRDAKGWIPPHQAGRTPITLFNGHGDRNAIWTTSISATRLEILGDL